MPRFVLLEHDHPVLHWDLMLECESSLRTWRLSELPPTGSEIAAEASFDHRLMYLDYEGEVSGGRGSVKRIDFGTFEWLVNEPLRIMMMLHGQRLHGKWTLAADMVGWRLKDEKRQE